MKKASLNKAFLIYFLKTFSHEKYHDKMVYYEKD